MGELRRRPERRVRTVYGAAEWRAEEMKIAMSQRVALNRLEARAMLAESASRDSSMVHTSPAERDPTSGRTGSRLSLLS